jgi:hypothetical protein
MKHLLLAVLVALAGECLYAAFHSPRFLIRRIQVVGAKTLSAEDVTRLTGLRPGTNIFRANLYRATRAIRVLPAIREANISRVLPDTIAVTLTEREPRFLLTVMTRQWEVDREGIVFREVVRPAAPAVPGARVDGSTPGPVPGPTGVPSVPGTGHRETGAPLPTILSLPPTTPVRLGQALDRSLIRAALHCAKLAYADGLKIWKIRVDGHGDLWLNIKVPGPSRGSEPSWTVRMGRAEQLTAKFADARKVIRGAPQLAVTAEYLDVSCPRRPAYRLAAGIDREKATPGPRGSAHPEAPWQ